MSYFLAKKLKGIANKMGFRTRLAPPSDALPAISDAVANTAVAKDTLESNGNGRQLKNIWRMENLEAVQAAGLQIRANHSGRGQSARTPTISGVVPNTAVAKDTLESNGNSRQLKSIWSMEKLEAIQAAGLQLLADRRVEMIVQDQHMPARVHFTTEAFTAALTDNGAFHLETHTWIPKDNLNWMDPMQIPFALVAVVVLLRGKNPHLHTLQNVIVRFRKIRIMVKETLKALGADNDHLNIAGHGIFTLPMAELAAVAARKYHLLLFTSAPGFYWADGMCTARHEALIDWVAATEKRVERSIKEFEKEMELVELRRRVANFDALLMAK
jgi:hypothetical protein